MITKNIFNNPYKQTETTTERYDLLVKPKTPSKLLQPTKEKRKRKNYGKNKHRICKRKRCWSSQRVLAISTWGKSNRSARLKEHPVQLLRRAWACYQISAECAKLETVQSDHSKQNKVLIKGTSQDEQLKKWHKCSNIISCNALHKKR